MFISLIKFHSTTLIIYNLYKHFLELVGGGSVINGATTFNFVISVLTLYFAKNITLIPPPQKTIFIYGFPFWKLIALTKAFTPLQYTIEGGYHRPYMRTNIYTNKPTKYLLWRVFCHHLGFPSSYINHQSSPWPSLKPGFIWLIGSAPWCWIQIVPFQGNQFCPKDGESSGPTFSLYWPKNL